MGLNSTPSADRIHIGIFGRRNAGKSSVINALTGQNLAIVSEIRGTTTDPVSKAMELLPLGPVIMIDTPGIDDVGELGQLRVKKSYQVLNKTDIAVVIIDAQEDIASEDKALISKILEKKIPCILVLNKVDLLDGDSLKRRLTDAHKVLDASCVHSISTQPRIGISELKQLIAKQLLGQEPEFRIVADLLCASDFVVLVVPIDKAAPKGRLILPQQQTIRDILEADATAIVVKEHELGETLEQLGKKPRLVITDSQVFQQVSAVTPKDIPLTSFSILFARYKGELGILVEGIKAIDSLKDGDKILISEGCTHHRQCDDIGTVKLPNWLTKYTGLKLEFTHTSGTEFPDRLSEYQLIIHCGGCMLNEREMKYRIACAGDADVPITNYGVLIAQMNGILKRSLEVFQKPPIT